MTTEIQQEARRRRTFAIISHPDAGKTTLTEKLLLYGGARELAGSVRGRKHARDTASDWMELEKQRGISVSSTVLQFDYAGYRINLLDTPGHSDFSEDTYRVLMAVDSAIMVLDAAKGIEERTRKLFEVCRSRAMPIITFVNKCDRPGKDPLALLDEIESQLGLRTCAVNLPVGNGPDFSGILERASGELHLFQRVAGGQRQATVTVGGIDDPAIMEAVPGAVRAHLADISELLEAAGDGLDTAAVARGELTPVFFGSAVNNFGVQALLDGFLRLASPPQGRAAGALRIEPGHAAFSAFVFKIQANMDPQHHDSLVFMRVCSGRFHRELQVRHAQSGKLMRLAHAHQIFGRDRETQEQAWPGDILGITGRSGLGIGDTLTEAADIVYDPIPPFAPECFIHLHHTDTRTFKRFRRGLDQLLQEKVVQRFFPIHTESRVPMLGAVGPLQFDVVRFRLQYEYGVETRVETASWKVTRWVDPAAAEACIAGAAVHRAMLVRDSEERLCVLFESDWSCQYFMRQQPEIILHSTPPVGR
jgi:peptide chain release factor 3